MHKPNLYESRCTSRIITLSDSIQLMSKLYAKQITTLRMATVHLWIKYIYIKLEINLEDIIITLANHVR